MRFAAPLFSTPACPAVWPMREASPSEPTPIELSFPAPAFAALRRNRQHPSDGLPKAEGRLGFQGSKRGVAHLPKLTVSPAAQSFW